MEKNEEIERVRGGEQERRKKQRRRYSYIPLPILCKPAASCTYIYAPSHAIVLHKTKIKQNRLYDVCKKVRTCEVHACRVVGMCTWNTLTVVLPSVDQNHHDQQTMRNCPKYPKVI